MNQKEEKDIQNNHEQLPEQLQTEINALGEEKNSEMDGNQVESPFSEQEKTREDKQSFGAWVKHSFTNKKFKQGAYSTLITSVVIIIVLVLNLLVGEMDLKIDLTSNALFTLSDATKDYVSGIKDDIKIYYLAEEGKEDDTFKKIVDKYGSISDHIKVETKDPILYPNFASQYLNNNEALYADSVIVVNETNGRSKYVSADTMITYEIDQTYQQYVPTGYDVEGQITSAIQYVTTETLPVIYVTEGHGEVEINQILSEYLKKQNVKTQNLKTISAEAIPEDCSILMILGPVYDFTKEEVTMIKDYLEKGGNAIIFTDYTSEDMTNFNSLLEYYGVKKVNGMVLESDSNYYMSQLPFYLLPDIESNEITSEVIKNKAPILVPKSIGLQFSDNKRSTINLEGFLTTTESAFAKTNLKSATYSKESSDIEGPFYLGIAVTENYDDIQTKLAIYSTSNMVAKDFLSFAQLGNADLLLNTINWMAEREAALTIPTKSLQTTTLNLNSSQSNFWSIIIVGIIPGIFLIAGVVIWIRRRKK